MDFRSSSDDHAILLRRLLSINDRKTVCQLIGKFLCVFFTLDYRNKTGVTNVVNLTISKVLPLYIKTGLQTAYTRFDGNSHQIRPKKSSNMKYLSSAGLI